MEYAKLGEDGIQDPDIQEVYLNQVAELKAQSISCFDLLLSTDLKDTKDVLKGHQLTEKFLAQLVSLSQNYLVVDTAGLTHPADKPQEAARGEKARPRAGGHQPKHPEGQAAQATKEEEGVVQSQLGQRIQHG